MRKLKEAIKRIIIIFIVMLLCMSPLGTLDNKGSIINSKVYASDADGILETYTGRSGIEYIHYGQAIGPWAEKQFVTGSGTVGTFHNNGCTATSTANVLSGYGVKNQNGQTITPEDTYAMGVNGTQKSWEIPFKAAGIGTHWANSNSIESEIKQAISEGKPVLIAIGPQAGTWYWPTVSHCIPIVDINGSRVRTLDPGRRETTYWDVDYSVIMPRIKYALIPDTAPDGATRNIDTGNVTDSASETTGVSRGDAVDLDTMSEFKFEGIPKKWSYTPAKNPLKWIFKLLSDFLDYLLGLIFGIVKSIVIGFIANIEKIIDDILIKVEGKDTDGIDYTSDTVEGDYIHYTIEDLIFDRVPALDVNLLSDKAGGEDVVENSALDIIRKTVAGWYVSIRNLAIILMLVMLIYTGIRMAITTIAADKANYQKQLYTWLKCFVLIFVIHYIILLVLNLNQIFCTMFQSDATKENVMYNTIKTRAYDVRLSVSFPGTVMYIALFIYWLKFLVMYLKRFVKNLILIILAPIVIVRYAIDNADSKGKSAFNNWLSNFVLNVFIQAVHALCYSVIMGVAIDLAINSISGFIIALVFMSYLLKFDDVVFQIFQFNGASGDRMMRPMKKPLNREFQDIKGKVFVYANFGKNLVGFGADGVRTIAGGTNGIVSGIRNADERRYQERGSSIGHNVSDFNDRVGKAVRGTKLGKWATNQAEVFRDVEAEVRPEQAAYHRLKRETKKLEKEHKKYHYGSGQIEANKKAIKKYKKQRKKIYKARGKTISKFAGSIAATTLVLPAMAVDPETFGVVMLAGAKTPLGFRKMVKDAKKQENKFAKGNDKVANAVNKANENSAELDSMISEARKLQYETQEAYKKIQNTSDKEVAIAEFRKLQNLNSSSAAIADILNRQVNNTNNDTTAKLARATMDEIDRTDVLSRGAQDRLAKIEENAIIEAQKKAQESNKEEDSSNEVNTSNSEGKKETFEDIENQRKGEKAEERREERRTFTKNESINYFDTDDVASKFSDAIVENEVSEQNVEIGKKINQMKNINYKSRKAGNGELIDINKFISNLEEK